MRGFFLSWGLVLLAASPLGAVETEETVSKVRSTSRSVRHENPSWIRHRRSIDLKDGAVRALAVSPDGQTAVAGGDRFVQLFDLKTGKSLRRFAGHTQEVLGVAFSPDGTLLASVGKQRMARETTVRLWSAKAESPARVIRIEDRFERDRITRVEFLPDGKRLVTCSPNSRSQNQVQLVDLEKGWWTYRARVVNPREPKDMAVSPDGSLIAVGDKLGVVALWEVVQFGIRARFPEDRGRHTQARYFRMHHASSVTSVAFSSDSRRLVSSGLDNTLRVWDVKTGAELLKITGRDQDAFAGANFSSDGGRIVSVTKTGTIQLREAANGKLLATAAGSEESVHGLRISPDATVLATFGGRGVVDVWGIRPNS